MLIYFHCQKPDQKSYFRTSNSEIRNRYGSHETTLKFPVIYAVCKRHLLSFAPSVYYPAELHIVKWSELNIC
jgi:hypothetical protein